MKVLFIIFCLFSLGCQPETRNKISRPEAIQRIYEEYVVQQNYDRFILIEGKND